MKYLHYINQKTTALVILTLSWIFVIILGAIYIIPKHIQATEIANFCQAKDAIHILFSNNFSNSIEKIIDEEIENFDKDYDYPPVSQKADTVRVPILMYHHIATLQGDPSDQRFFVTPQMFDKQMGYLREKHYKTLTPAELYEQINSQLNPKQKSILLTFDDGNYNNYKYAFPILRKYNLVGVFYINSSHLKIPPQDLKEMSDAGMVIASHSKNHINLKAVRDNTVLDEEIYASKSALEAITGKSVNSFAYPGCAFDNKVISKVEESGYLIGLSCGKTIDHREGDRYKLSRLHVVNNFENFKKLLSGIWEVTGDFEE